MKYDWQLINDNFSEVDREEVISWLRRNPRLTQGPKVKEFEDAWSEWLGVKHSVFVNSGASANFIMFCIANELKAKEHFKKTGRKAEIITSPLGWVSDVSPILMLGMKPVFVDVNMSNMSMDINLIKDAITEDTIAINLVHVLGFNAVSSELVQICDERRILLIEDCCESHGATYLDAKIGTFGDLSNFSFYFGHHMTTVEGGMVCTNDDDLYDYIKLFRSHGMTRETSQAFSDKYSQEWPELNPLFTFAVPAINLRNTEFNAVVGLSQLKRLNGNIHARTANLNIWLDNLDKEVFFTDFDRTGSSNFSLPLIINGHNKRIESSGDLQYVFDCVEKLLCSENVEYRVGTAGGGNQTRQPYLQNGDYEYKIHDELKNTDFIHHYGLYIGNHPELTPHQIISLCDKLNSLI